MRRRERWQNISWLQWMSDDTGEGMVCTEFAAPLAVGSALNTLVRDYGRYVDMEATSDCFLVRVLPREPRLEHSAMAMGMAYSGSNLRNILTTAVVECDMLSGGEVAYRTGSTEKTRWVR